MSVWYSGLCLFFFFFLIGYWCKRKAEASQKILVISPWQHLQWWKDVCRHCQRERVLEWERQEQVWRNPCPGWTLPLSLSPYAGLTPWATALPGVTHISPEPGCSFGSSSCRQESLDAKLKGCLSSMWWIVLKDTQMRFLSSHLRLLLSTRRSGEVRCTKPCLKDWDAHIVLLLRCPHFVFLA